MYRKLLFGQEAREKIKTGVNIVADAVVSTLGPRGQNVIFEDGSVPVITKDGVTVAQQVFLEDSFENMGNMLAREAAQNTNREAGDGTTTTIVLLREIFNECHKAIVSGMNPVLIKRGMDQAQKKVVEEIEKQAKQIKTDKERLQVATISSNNDKEIGDLICSVLKKVGTDGVITVSSSNSLDTQVEYVKGTALESGFLNHIFINDQKHLTVNLDNVTIIVTTEQILMQSQLVPLIQKLLEAGKKNIVLLADKVEGQALGFMIQNYLQGKFICVPIIIPSFGGWQKDLIYDLATLTQATVLGEAKKIEDAEVEDCGYCKNIIIGRDKTIFVGGRGNVNERIAQVKTLIEKEKDIFAKDRLKSRLGRLAGSIANIQVGGASESEQTEIRYRIEDALNATKSAIEDGIVEGGGVCLLKCSNFKIESSEGKEFDMGVEIVRNALRAPLKQIAKNGGLSGDAITEKVLSINKGYNALTNQYEDLFKSGVIDPAKVVKNEIINAVATAGILLTSNVAISSIPEKK